MNVEYLELMAERMEMARIAQNDGVEYDESHLEFWAHHSSKSTGPILELGCGGGKILIPLLEKGFDIAGVDTSDAMLSRCREKCRKKNLQCALYNQPMQNLNVPEKFGLVLGDAGLLSLFVTDADITATLESVKRHLMPNGSFICSFEQANEKAQEWCSGERDGVSGWFKGVNGAIYAHRELHKKCPAGSNTWEYLLIIEKFVDGNLVKTEANHRVGRFFTVDEVCAFFESVGFKDINVTKHCSDEPADESTDMVMVRCSI